MENLSYELIQKNLVWREALSIGKGPLYLLEERLNKIGENKKPRVAGWVQLNEGKFEAVVPGLPSEAIFNSSITTENSAISVGVYNNLEAAKSAVEKHLPNEKEWIHL